MLDEILCAFIPPCPDTTYVLDQETFEWYPNPNLVYDLHNNGELCKYNYDTKDWRPV
jgi:hypothetical protein